ncbi:hypothetical protein H7J88_26820 [Mycolicibacterium flavescens]|uniref:WXG100 family type VII secretion target n=1 Tax=Mycolicibacterium flavescens TaxID=1776 RepID=A0A1E3RPK0_MYCFV|nr:hypothetical protein [Mycolicibacterium flavescens]MCV7283254.1 hypothetical protein [Mycolicibacterium flavescens]ODQ91825.1 hypothetical protein BHQ18_02905 [Mycolicibacterium flavescens]
MADPLGVTPPDLRAASQHLNDVSTRMKEVLSTLRDSLSGEGAAWGDDKIGDQYANGDSGYLAQQDWVDGSVAAKTGLLDYYSTGLKEAADSFEQQDQG